MKLKKLKWMQNIRVFLMFILAIYLSGCASSNVSREANDNAVVGYQNATATFGGAGNGSIADSYGNMSQTTKGVMLGGAVGAAVGGATTGVGALTGLASGAILGGAYGAYLDSNISLTDQLENRGVKVMILGDQIRLVMLSATVFNAYTPEIRPGAYSTLDLVARFLNQYTTMSVRVAAYTNATGSARIAKAISKEQAESVVRYLWRRGVNTRMLTSFGMGGANLVTANSPDLDSGWNYRVEITAEKLPITGTTLG